jgi:Flp pilus assembly protein TadG
VRESGQILLLFVLLIPILAGMVGMSVDLGSYASDRRTLQNAADSIALAAAQQLPDASAAQTIATTYEGRNNIDPSRVTVTVSGGTTAPKVSVSITRPHNFAFLRVLGVNSTNVSAKAAALKVSFGGGSGIVPWAVTQAMVDSAKAEPPGYVVTMKYDATGGNTGNFDAIRAPPPTPPTLRTAATHSSAPSRRQIASREPAPALIQRSAPRRRRRVTDRSARRRPAT